MQSDRRLFLRQAGIGTAALALAPWHTLAADQTGFTLPKLPYASDALEPHIDKQTMEIHHGKHHQAYVDNLNKTLSAGQPELLKKPIEALLREIDQVKPGIRQLVINNGGGHANHSLFWEIMSPKGGGEPTGPLAKAIAADLGSFDKFQAALADAAAKQFGSGWAWLVLHQGKLQVSGAANQDSPLMKGATPLLGLDVWEHAYYLKYQNRRADYVKAWWSVVNWKAVSERHEKALKA